MADFPSPIRIYSDRATAAAAAAKHAAQIIRDAIAERGEARIIAATGASQFEFVNSLVSEPDIEWTEVEMFHLDEYVDLSIDHPASFRRYLLDLEVGGRIIEGDVAVLTDAGEDHILSLIHI